jgi:hypothetical protein
MKAWGRLLKFNINENPEFVKFDSIATEVANTTHLAIKPGM